MTAGKTDIWMPVYIGDYLADTMHLSTEQHGAYLLLLFHLWRRGALPDEDAVLAKTAGLEKTAWQQMRPVLAEFFEIHDGQWTHRRVERERSRVNKVSKSNSEKALLAAQKRWQKTAARASEDARGNASSIARGIAPSIASGIAPSTAPSIAPGMLDRAKPQSQAQSEAETNTTRVSKETRDHPDARYLVFRGLLAEYWRAKNHASPEMPWQRKDATALQGFLTACPHVTRAQFRQLLLNRARSAVAHGDWVYLWIANITRFQEPMTVYNKPVSAGGVNHANSRAEINRDSVVNAVDRAIAMARESVAGPGEVGAEPAALADSGVPADDGAGSGGCSLALPGEGDYGMEKRDSADGEAGTNGSLPYRAPAAGAGGAAAVGGLGGLSSRVHARFES